MKQKLKRSFLFTIIFLLLSTLYILPAYALDIVPHDYIVDEADVLSNKEEEALEQLINDAPFELYVQVLNSVGNQAIADYADETYLKAGLDERSALLVIDMDLGDVYLAVEVNNLVDYALQNSTRIHSSDKISSFIEQSFLPKAFNGDFAGAINQTIIDLQTDVVAFQNGGSNTSGGVTDYNPSTGGSSQVNRSNVQITGSAILIMLAAGVILLLVIVIYSRKRQKRLYQSTLASLDQSLEELLGNIHSIEAKLTPLIKFSTGQTKEVLKDAENKLYDLLQQAASYPEQLRQLKSNKKVSKAQLRKAQSLIQPLRKMEADAKYLSLVVQDYEKVDAETHRLLHEKKKNYEQGLKLLSQIQRNEQRTLVALFQQVDEIAHFIKRVEQQAAFDSFGANQQLSQKAGWISDWYSDVKSYADLLQQVERMPALLHEAKLLIDQKLSGITQLGEINPHSFLTSASKQLQSTEAALNEGRIAEAKKGLTEMTNSIQVAIQLVDRYIAARDLNGSKISKFKDKVQQYKQLFQHEIALVLGKARQDYHESHWQKAINDQQQLTQSYHEVMRLLEQAAVLHEKEHKYLEADELLQQIEQQLKANHERIHLLLNFVQELDRKRSEYIKKLDYARQTLTNIKQNSNRAYGVNYRRGMTQEAEAAAWSAIQSTEQMLASKPYHFTSYDASFLYLEQAIQHYSNVIQQVLKENDQELTSQDVLRRMAEAELRRQINKRFPPGGGFGGGFGGGGFGGGSGGFGGGGRTRGGGGGFGGGGGMRGGGGSFGGGGRTRGGGGSFGGGGGMRGGGGSFGGGGRTRGGGGKFK